MKKMMTFLLFWSVLAATYGQTSLYISGNVTGDENGAPVPNHAVYIQSDSLHGGNIFPYYKVVYTNTGGMYADTVVLPAGVNEWSFRLTTFDCENEAHDEEMEYDGSTTVFTHDFEICTQAAGCIAEFSIEEEHDSTSGKIYHFEDHSEGNIISWNWNFGDGTSSNEQSPYHTYVSDGIYQVCLTIQGADSSCFDTECDTLFVGGGSGCQAQFTYYQDSVPANNYEVQFMDLSLGNPESWHWYFGDSTYSEEQNPVHTFPGPGSYYVCLTIECENTESTWCQLVVLENNPGCTNYFTYQQYGLDVSFNGFLVNPQPASFTWNFGDGSTATGESVTHTYSAQGIYYVSLTTIITDSMNCTYTSSQTIQVGDSAQFNQIYGQVFAGQYPLQTGIAMIFSLDSNQNYTPYIATCPIDSMGIYYFSMVPSGNYYVYAIPFVPDDYLPTYYGDKLEWEEATIISLGQAANPYNIHLISEDSCDQGDGGINGQINMGGIRANFLDKITMILMNAQGEPIGFYRVSPSGGFTFSSLGYGTYLLRAEIPGITSDVVQVIISGEKPIADVVMTFAGNKLLGLNEEKAQLVAGSLYPNPANDHASINVTSEKAGTIYLEIYDLTGRMVLSLKQNVEAGLNTIGIRTGSLPSGIYTLLIRSGDGMKLTQKLLKQ